MKIEESEIWYSYSTIYSGPEISFDLLAQYLLKTDLTKCIFSSTGNIYYYNNNKIETEHITCDMALDKSQATFHLSNYPDKKFLEEMIYQNLFNYYCEQRIFSFETNFIDNSYIRFSIDKFIIETNNNLLNIYPFITIYNSGIIILEMRIISNADIDVDNFINEYVNLGTCELKSCYVNKIISDYSHIYNIDNQITKKIIDETCDLQTELYEMFFKENNQKSLMQVALQTFFTLEMILNKPFELNKKFKHLKFDIGLYWIAKPHIHILKYSNQCNSASETLKQNEADIKKILNRVATNISNYKDESTLIDNRVFEDFNTFFNLSLSLNIWSLIGLKNNEVWQNKNIIVHANQVINKYLDYYYMLYKKTLYAIEKTNNYNDILKFQSDFYYMQNDFNQFAKSGELRNLFYNAKKEFEIDKYEEIIRNLLEIKRLELENKKNNSFNKMSLVIAILFGIVSIGSFANDFLKPTWKLFRLPLLKNNDFNDFLFWILSLIIIFLILKIFHKKFK